MKFLLFGVILTSLTSLPFIDADASHHALAMHGKPLYPPDFSHLSYVNPNAPQGGRLRLARIGSFDSLNPLIPLGAPAYGIRQLVYESLLTRGLDEPFTLYGLLASHVEMARDRSFVIFTLNDKARFSNGQKVEIEDVIFSANLLREQGRPNHRLYYSKIAHMDRLSANRVKFTFTKDANWEMPLIIGLMPILSKAHFKDKHFDKSRSLKPLGSGPYIVSQFELGQVIHFRRNRDYWGQGLPINRGRFNFDEIVLQYYRDDQSAFEAFKTNYYDMREETSPQNWALNYDFRAIKSGDVQKKSFFPKSPAPFWAMVFNLRREIFSDKNIRKALIASFDGDWMRQNLFYSLWQQSDSFWVRSNLSSRLIHSDSGNSHSGLNAQTTKKPSPKNLSPRQLKKHIFALFKKAGYGIQNQKMTHLGNGQVFQFEIIVRKKQNERIALIWAQRLKSYGVQAKLRFVDDSQYQRLRQNFNYDMIFARWYLSLSPGNEQAFYWGSHAARQKASRNYAGIASPHIDALIAKIANAPNRKILVQTTRQLDKALLEGHYMIPLFYQKAQWVALWKPLRWFKKTSLYGYQWDSWWIEK